MSASHLGNTPLDVAKLRDVIRKRLPELLDTVRGKKGLILDPQLTGPLSLVAEIPLLKDHGVEKIYHLDDSILDTDCKNLIYICRPKLKYMKYIAAQIRKDRQDTSKRIEYSLFFVPQRTMLCERVLEEEGVLGDITLGEYAMEWIPFEDDLISMELDNNTWKELNLDGDATAIHQAAKSLMKLQQIYGLFPRIIGKGDSAKALADMLIRMRREQSVVDEVSSSTMRKNPSLLNSLSSHIDQLVIIDRNVDLYTPLCTQLTYEGLIDEIFGIKHSFVELDQSLVSAGTQPQQQQAQSGPSSGAPGKKKNYALNSSDKLFAQLCDLNFAVVGGLLNRIAKRINENYEERHQAKTMAQIRTFVGKLPDLQQEHQSLRTHTGIAEEIMSQTITEEFNRMLEAQQNLVAGVDSNMEVDYIEELIDKQEPITKVLRVLCLMSLVQGGIKAKTFELFKREIVQTYGYEHLQTLHDLERVGLFVIRTSSNASRAAFANVRRTLRLIVNEVDEHNPADISYVYSGYAPLSVRLVQCAVQKISAGHAGGSVPGIGLFANVVGGGSSNTVGSNHTHEKGKDDKSDKTAGWKGYEDILKLLPGTAVDEVQTEEVKNEREAKATAARAKRSLGSHHRKTTIVFFLGGCTYTEVSAIRFLGQQDEGIRDYLVATTQMINGNTLLESMIQNSASNREDTAEGVL
ncbi:hypothetical protein INT43_006760 [Umbelopsis isabellina]|uniref:Vacuolar protein sorting-associated protein 33A n=1 Tax=Mortierella isabellina TaxID=91625 RepID=A0A8H7PZS7_MORIS|nr:hypothetical protein INT43_006760 [Umbelopsis isabellina]